MSLARAQIDVDPITIQFPPTRNNQEIKARVNLAAEQARQQPKTERPPVPIHKIVMYGSVGGLLLISVVSLIWIAAMAADGVQISRAALFVNVNVLWVSIFAFSALINRGHHDRTRRDEVAELRAEIRAAGLGQTAAVHSALSDFKVQMALLRAETTAQIDQLREEVADYGERCDSEGAIRAHETHQARAVVGVSLAGSNVVAAQSRFRV